MLSGVRNLKKSNGAGTNVHKFLPFCAIEIGDIVCWKLTRGQWADWHWGPTVKPLSVLESNCSLVCMACISRTNSVLKLAAVTFAEFRGKVAAKMNCENPRTAMSINIVTSHLLGLMKMTIAGTLRVFCHLEHLCK